ncbi:MAG: replication-relaxation family protein [candidate division Zixibacteria bacterium]|nr:replication-relaxation family protein [candidate division Zixibacteria bacterium]
MLDQHLLLTREQLQLLLDWPCVTRINRRLRQLFDAGLVERRFLPVQSGSAPAIYYLGREAISHLASTNSRDSDTLLRRRRRIQRMPDSTLGHDLAISDFAASFIRHCLKTPGGEWISWLNEYAFLNTCQTTKLPLAVMPRPDGYGRYAINRLLYHFCLELDTGSESLRRLRRKLQAYQMAQSSGYFRKLFKLSRLTVLIVTTSSGRAANLAARLQQSSSLRVLVGTLPQVTHNPLFGSVWNMPGQQTTTSLHRQEVTKERG